MNKLKKELLEEIKKSMPISKNNSKRKISIGMKYKTLKKEANRHRKDFDEVSLLKYFNQ